MNYLLDDETRVILEKLPDDPYSDYINANYIMVSISFFIKLCKIIRILLFLLKGYGGNEKAYIATQGPKSNTVIDFWRMVYQEKVRIICMMANIIENGKVSLN
jgi:protein tyrosine phosphatase